MSRFLVVWTLSAVLLPSMAQAADSPTATLESAARDSAAKLERGGIVVGVHEHGKAAKYSAFGTLEVVAKDAPPETLIFEIGSISKLFTGLLLAQAVVEGKVALADPIDKYLGDGLGKANAKVRGITLEQLATHRSCLPRLPDNLAPKDPADPYVDYDATALYAFLSAHTLDGTPPCDSQYSNLGFGVLGQVIEAVYGQPWAAVVAEKIAEPAGMIDTVQTLDPARARRFVSANAGAAAASPWQFDVIAGAGALRSTAADMLSLGDALLDPEHPLAPAWKLASTLRADVPAVGGRIGLAVMEGKQRGEPYFWHNGGTGGFRTEFRIYPVARRVEALLINNAALDPGAVYAHLEPPAATVTGQTETAIGAERLAELTGVYAIDSQERFTILLRAGKPWARLTGQSFLPIFHSKDERFFYKAVPAELQFVRDGKGSVTEVVLFQNSREFHAKRSGEAPALLFPDAKALADYVGSYQLAPGAEFKVSINADTLFAQLTGQQALPVFAVAADRFDYDAVVASLAFERDAQGKVVALVLHQNGAEQRAPKAEE